MSQGKVGFYGGTFDPIHFGHISLAVDLMEAHGLDEVWFCPANQNPFKTDQKITPITHRMAMTELALGANPRFQLLDMESQREGPSYTLDTLRELTTKENKRTHPREIFLLLSDETASAFINWYKPDEIIKLCPLLIGSRLSSPSSFFPPAKKNFPIFEAIKRGWTQTRLMDISSTDIRERLQKGLFCGHLVPEKVLDYIYRNQLYYSI